MRGVLTDEELVLDASDFDGAILGKNDDVVQS